MGKILFCQVPLLLSTYPLVVVVEVVVVVVVEVVVVALASPAGAGSVPRGAIVVVVVTGSGHTVVRASTHLQHGEWCCISWVLHTLSYSSLVVTVPSSSVIITLLQFW